MEGGEYELDQLSAEAAQSGGRDRPSDSPQGLRFGRDTSDRGVDERNDETRIRTPQPTGVHLVAQVVRGSTDERLHLESQPFGMSGREPTHLADETEQRRAPNGWAEDCLDDGLHPSQRLVGRRTNGCLDHRGELQCGLFEHRVE